MVDKGFFGRLRDSVVKLCTESPNYFADEAELPALADYNPAVTWKTKTSHDLLPPKKSNVTQAHAVSCYFIQDTSTGYCYLDEEGNLVRQKHLALLIATPFVHFLGLLTMMGVDTVVAVSCFGRVIYQLFLGNFKHCCEVGGQLGLRVGGFFCKPVVWCSMIMVNASGLFFPLGGRKLYATLERTVYWRPVLAPCFQPVMQVTNKQREVPKDCRKNETVEVNTPEHFFGGNTW